MAIKSARFKNEPILEACISGTYRMTIGETSVRAVYLIQQALIDLGYKLPEFGPDGKFGTETANAVARYKADRGITPSDGVVGQKTMESLDNEFINETVSLPPPVIKPGEIYINDYIQAVIDVESKYSTDTAEEILTRLRQLYYPSTDGPSSSELSFDQLMLNSPVRETNGNRRIVKKLYVGEPTYCRLTTKAYENAVPPDNADNPSPYIIDSEGNRVDIGHVLLAIDALTHDVTGIPYNLMKIPSIDPAWWVADIGIAAVWAEKDKLLTTSDAPRVLPRLQTGEPDLQGYYKMSAPDSDLLGDIDGVSILELWKGIGGPLSGVLTAYYLGTSTDPPAYHRRFRTFTDLYFGIPAATGPILFPGMVRSVWVSRINRFCDLYSNKDNLFGIALQIIIPDYHHWIFTDQVLDIFLAFVFTGYKREAVLHP